MIKNDKIIVITPANNEQLYRYLIDKFSPCTVPNEPVKGFKIEPVYDNNITELRCK
jgi:hypothetical protein